MSETAPTFDTAAEAERIAELPLAERAAALGEAHERLAAELQADAQGR